MRFNLKIGHMKTQQNKLIYFSYWVEEQLSHSRHSSLTRNDFFFFHSEIRLEFERPLNELTARNKEESNIMMKIVSIR